MINPIIKSFIKITIFSLIFIVLFQIWNQVINAWWWSSDEKTTNIDNFQSIDNYWFSEIWVALNINIWTKFYEWKKEESNSFYNEVISISTIKSDRTKTNEIIIKKNLDTLRDYKNIVKIDIKSYLDSQSERKDSYESLMNQLKVRYKMWYANSKNLSTQIDALKIYLQQLDNSIDNTKQSIALNMRNYNAIWVSRNINDYIILKDEYNLIRVYLIFCSRFQTYYTVLNNYNKDTITALRLNEDAIINNIYVVIPNSWTDLINKLNLLYEEWWLPENLNTNLQNDTLSEGTWNNTIWDITIDNYNLDYDIHYDTSTSINNNYEWIFWDPYNLKNTNLETPKQTWNINFGAPK